MSNIEALRAIRRVLFFQETVHPAGDLAQTGQTAAGLARSAQLVILAEEITQPRLHAEDLQGRVKLERLLVRTAAILRGMDEQRRRLHVPHVLERRGVPRALRIGQRAAAALLVGAEIPADVADAVEGDPVADAALRGRALEAAAVRDHPVGHVTAVRSAGHSQALRVDKVEMRDRPVEHGVEVLIVLDAVEAADVRELVAAPVAAARIAEDHRVAERRPALGLVEIQRAVRRLGAAVDVEDRRIFFARFGAHRFHVPAVDRQPLAVVHRIVFGLRKLELRHERIVVMRQLRFFARSGGVQFLQLQAAESYDDHSPAARVETIGRKQTRRQAAVVSVQVVEVDLTARPLRGNVIQAVAVDQAVLRFHAVTAVADHAVVEAGVEIRRQTGQFFVLQLEDQGVLVHAVAFHVAGDDDDAPAAPARRLETVLEPFAEAVHRAAFEVEPPDVTAQRFDLLVLFGHQQRRAAAGRQRAVEHVHAVGRQAPELAGLRIPQRQRGAALAGKVLAVLPERDLRVNLVLRVLGIRFFRRVNGAEQNFAVRQRPQVVHGQRHDAQAAGFAAAEFQPVERRRVLLQRGVALRRENQRFAVRRPARSFVGVGEGDLTAAPRAAVVQPQVGVVAVLFEVGLGDLIDRQRAVRRKPRARKELEMKQIVELYRFLFRHRKASTQKNRFKKQSAAESLSSLRRRFS